MHRLELTGNVSLATSLITPVFTALYLEIQYARTTAWVQWSSGTVQ